MKDSYNSQKQRTWYCMIHSKQNNTLHQEKTLCEEQLIQILSSKSRQGLVMENTRKEVFNCRNIIIIRIININLQVHYFTLLIMKYIFKKCQVLRFRFFARCWIINLQVHLPCWSSGIYIFFKNVKYYGLDSLQGVE